MISINGLKPLRSGRINTGARSNTYYIRDHGVLWVGNAVRGANLQTFEYYKTGYAKDDQTCEINDCSYLYAKEKDNFYRMEKLMSKDEFYGARTKDLNLTKL